MKMIWRNVAFLVSGAILGIAGPSRSQAPVSSQPRNNFETRAELEALAKTAESKQQKTDLWLIRNRLTQGDFQNGDRIVVTVQGVAGFSDTLMVRSGRQLELPGMAPLPLQGILRSELVSRLSTHIGRFIRDPVVRARPLVRLGVLGNVARPGFYYTAADVPLSDVLMTAGGPGADADVKKISVSRDGQVIVDERNTALALKDGLSMDALHMQAGDELQVGKQAHFNWGVVIPTISALVGVLIAASQMHR
jgi:hypothetical protein